MSMLGVQVTIILFGSANLAAIAFFAGWLKADVERGKKWMEITGPKVEDVRERVSMIEGKLSVGA